MVHFFKHTTESYSYIIPRHRILGDLKGKEKDEVLIKYKCDVTQLPKIQKNDPAIASLHSQVDDVIEILRSSSTAGESLYYRSVISPDESIIVEDLPPLEVDMMSIGVGKLPSEEEQCLDIVKSFGEAKPPSLIGASDWIKVGRADEIRKIRKKFRKPQSVTYIQADTGKGKSFFIHLIRDLLIKKGCISIVEMDKKNISFLNPAKFVTGLKNGIQTLDAKGNTSSFENNLDILANNFLTGMYKTIVQELKENNFDHSNDTRKRLIMEDMFNSFLNELEDQDYVKSLLEFYNAFTTSGKEEVMFSSYQKDSTIKNKNALPTLRLMAKFCENIGHPLILCLDGFEDSALTAEHFQKILDILNECSANIHWVFAGTTDLLEGEIKEACPELHKLFTIRSLALNDLKEEDYALLCSKLLEAEKKVKVKKLSKEVKDSCEKHIKLKLKKLKDKPHGIVDLLY